MDINQKYLQQKHNDPFCFNLTNELFKQIFNYAYIHVQNVYTANGVFETFCLHKQYFIGNYTSTMYILYAFVHIHKMDLETGNTCFVI